MNRQSRRRQRAEQRPTLDTLEQRTLLSAGFVDFPLANGSGATPEAITADKRGDIWFTEATGSGAPAEIGRITPNGKMTLLPIPGSDGASVKGIAAGPDGNIWFTVAQSVGSTSEIGRITPNGKITEFPLPNPSNQPVAITAGPDGDLWFTEFSPDDPGEIGRITPKGAITQFPVPAVSGGYGITVGRDGDLWFGIDDGVGRMTPGGTVTEFTLPSQQTETLYGVTGVTAGPDGDVWFTNLGSLNGDAVVGRVAPNGVVTSLDVPVANGQTLSGITAGPDGDLWFTETGPAGSAIGRLTPSGAAALYPTPNPQADPSSIVAGPGGALWYTEASAIGKLVPNATPAALPVTAAPVAANDGTPFNGVVATFQGLPSNRAASDYSARIDWGDGGLSTGTVVANGHGSFAVTGTHPYTEPGTDPVTVTVFDENPGGRKPGPSTTATANAQVADAPLALSGTTIVAIADTASPAGVPTVLASGLVQQVPGDRDWTITVNWGDGTTSPGAILPLNDFGPAPVYDGEGGVPPAPSPFPLSIWGNHVYQAPGTYHIQITIHVMGGATTIVTSTANVSPPPLVV